MQDDMQILDPNSALPLQDLDESTAGVGGMHHQIHPFSQDALLHASNLGIKQNADASNLVLEQVDLEELEDSDADDSMPQKKSGRRKIRIEYIGDRIKRHVTFSKRKGGLMKKAYELSTLTGTQVLLLVASETGYVYTFATPKFQPIVSQNEGKAMIQQCLNSLNPLRIPQTPQSAGGTAYGIPNPVLNPFPNFENFTSESKIPSYFPYPADNIFLGDFPTQPGIANSQRLLFPPSGYWPVMPTQNELMAIPNNQQSSMPAMPTPFEDNSQQFPDSTCN